MDIYKEWYSSYGKDLTVLNDVLPIGNNIGHQNTYFLDSGSGSYTGNSEIDSIIENISIS
jgi:hypothetical protein